MRGLLRVSCVAVYCNACRLGVIVEDLIKVKFAVPFIRYL